MRARSWSARACEQYRQSVRTWFCTFTLSPTEHQLLEAEAAAKAKEKYPAENLPDKAALLKLQCVIFQKRVKAWLDRCKVAAKLAGRPVNGNVKYLLVAEVHDSEQTSAEMRGRPHFHMLLHEAEIGALISDSECEWAKQKLRDGTWLPYYRVRRDATLRQQWQFGLSELKLATNEKSVYYVCEYLYKAPMHRVVASIGYGKTQSQHENVDEEDALG